MKKIGIVFSVLLTVVLMFTSCEKKEISFIDQELYEQIMESGSSQDIVLDSNTAIKAASDLAWKEFKDAERRDEQLVYEMTNKQITFGSKTMRFDVKSVGMPGPNGYPLYIALHGGGQTTPEVNDSQWNHMKIYYYDSVNSGIYVAPRGVSDTWDTHFNAESYPMYERLIEIMSVYYGIDTNRVYLVGYSAGGDGVWQITPKMADRFAAANMSAGHPNGADLTNLYNTPFQIQCGQNDNAVAGRNTECGRYCEVLDQLQYTYGGGYEHNVNIHFGKQHGIEDNDPLRSEQVILTNPIEWSKGGEAITTTADTNAVSFLERYRRNPIPEKIVWSIGNRPSECDTETFYWLRATKDISAGTIVATYDKSKNTINIERMIVLQDEGEIFVMLNADMVDFTKPVTVIVNGIETEYNVTPSLEYINKTIEERCDPNMIFAAEIKIR